MAIYLTYSKDAKHCQQVINLDCNECVLVVFREDAKPEDILLDLNELVDKFGREIQFGIWGDKKI